MLLIKRNKINTILYENIESFEPKNKYNNIINIECTPSEFKIFSKNKKIKYWIESGMKVIKKRLISEEVNYPHFRNNNENFLEYFLSILNDDEKEIFNEIFNY